MAKKLDPKDKVEDKPVEKPDALASETDEQDGEESSDPTMEQILADFPKTTTEQMYADALEKDLDQDVAAFEDGYRAFIAAGGPQVKPLGSQAPGPV